MEEDKSGAGYGNHGGDGSMGGQDGKKSKDHEQARRTTAAAQPRGQTIRSRAPAPTDLAVCR